MRSPRWRNASASRCHATLDDGCSIPACCASASARSGWPAASAANPASIAESTARGDAASPCSKASRTWSAGTCRDRSTLPSRHHASLHEAFASTAWRAAPLREPDRRGRAAVKPGRTPVPQTAARARARSRNRRAPPRAAPRAGGHRYPAHAAAAASRDVPRQRHTQVPRPARSRRWPTRCTPRRSRVRPTPASASPPAPAGRQPRQATPHARARTMRGGATGSWPRATRRRRGARGPQPRRPDQSRRPRTRRRSTAPARRPPARSPPTAAPRQPPVTRPGCAAPVRACRRARPSLAVRGAPPRKPGTRPRTRGAACCCPRVSHSCSGAPSGASDAGSPSTVVDGPIRRRAWRCAWSCSRRRRSASPPWLASTAVVDDSAARASYARTGTPSIASSDASSSTYASMATPAAVRRAPMRFATGSVPQTITLAPPLRTTSSANAASR